MHGAPAARPETHTPRTRPGHTALVVDDSVSELVGPRLADDARVHRVLFVRALL